MKKFLTLLVTAFLVLGAVLFLWDDENLEDYDHEDDTEEGYGQWDDGDEDPYDTDDDRNDDLGTGASNATVLIYMVGSDLESDDGCASKDIMEMCKAKLTDKVNVIIQSGGAKDWHNSYMTDGYVERFAVKNKSLEPLGTVGACKKVSMADPKTLTDFLRWGVQTYPADRYGVIFWNHGGGTVMGFGADEYHSDDMLELNEIQGAFASAGVKVDFVGFDACLMGTVETIYALSDYADYLIASEETEPGTGWYYTDWLNLLAKDPGVSIKKLGAKIIDDFVEGPDSSFWDDRTLALFDLSKAHSLYFGMAEYMSQSRTVLMNNGFRRIANARTSVRSYGDDGYEQIDVLSYLDKAGVDSSHLEQIVKDTILYYKGNISSSTGMAMYYPYSYPDYYTTVYRLMNSIGMNDREYLGYFNDFVSILSGGKKAGQKNGASLSSIQQLTGAEEQPTEAADYSGEEWYNSDAAENNVDLTALFTTDEELELTPKGDGFILDLTDEQWAAISKVEMELYVGDGEGYLFLGRDSLVKFDEHGDLIADFDFTWVTINDQLVPFYIISDNEDENGWEATGYVPATLNADTPQEQDINLFVRWDSEHEEGYVMGYTLYEESEAEITMPARNYLSFAPGDTLDFYCDYYDLDGNYEACYYVGDTVTVTEEPLVVSYGLLEDDTEVEIGYHLLDLYRNEYWTEVLSFE